jgi:AsmA protein
MVSDGKIRIDDSAVNLKLKIADFSKPDFTFDLTLDRIDADRYLPPGNGDRRSGGQPSAAKSKGSSTAVAPSSAPTPKPFIAALAALDGRLQAGQVIISQKKIEDIRITLSGKTGPIKLALAARLKEGPLAVNGFIGPHAVDADRQMLPLDLRVEAIDQLKLHASGKLLYSGETPSVEMAVKVDDFSPRKLLAALGQPFPIVTPDSGAVNRVALAANLKAAADSLAISDGQVIFDESKMKVAIRAANFAKPDIAFDLNIDQINLDRYLPLQYLEKSAAVQPSAASGSKSSQKETGRVPASATGAGYEPLRRLIIAGQLQAGKLTVNNLKLQDVGLKINGKNGLFTIDPLNLNLYQGNLTGKGQFDVQQKEPASDFNFMIENVQIGPLLKDAAQQDILEGSTRARINLTLKGDTDERVRRTLNGQGEIRVNDGAVKGFDLAAMARNLESAFGLGVKEAKTAARPRTDFTELLLPFTITDGIAATSKANLKSPFIRLEASGKADLVKETLDFYIDPKAVATIKGQGDEKTRSGILVPIIVSGTFTELKFRPDIKRIITQQVDQGILESEPAKKLFEKKEMKKFEEPAKQLLKDLLKKP